MRRFVQAFAVFVQRSGRQHTDRAGQHGGFVGEDIAEDVAGGNHVKLFGCAYQLHGGIVDVHMGKLNIRILFADFFKDFAPQFGGFQNVGFAYGADFFAAFLGGLEGNVGNTADFAFAVFHGVVAFAFAVFQNTDAARFAKVNIAGQFAYDKDVKAGYNFRFQSGSIGQLFIQNGRAQISKQIQVFTDGQQAAFRAQRTVEIVVLRRTDCTKQDRIGVTAKVLREFWIRMAVFVIGFAAQRCIFVADIQTLFDKFVEYTDGFCNDFRANAVAAQDSDMFGHL